MCDTNVNLAGVSTRRLLRWLWRLRRKNSGYRLQKQCGIFSPQFTMVGQTARKWVSISGALPGIDRHRKSKSPDLLYLETVSDQMWEMQSISDRQFRAVRYGVKRLTLYLIIIGIIIRPLMSFRSRQVARRTGRKDTSMTTFHPSFASTR